MKRNKEYDWIYAGVFAFFVVRVLPWLIVLGLVVCWIVKHVRVV